MAGEVAGKCGALRQRLYEPRDVLTDNRVVRRPALWRERAEDGAARDLGSCELRLNRPSGVERHRCSQRDGDLGAVAFLISLRATDRDQEPALREAQILDGERGKLGAPQRADEPEQNDREFALRRDVVAADGQEQFADHVNGRRVDPADGRALLSSDASDDVPDDQKRETGESTHLRSCSCSTVIAASRRRIVATRSVAERWVT